MGVETKLLSRKQLPSESLDSYASDIMHWGKQIKKGEDELMHTFVRGLLPSIRAFVFSKEPTTFLGAIENARLAVSVEQTAKESPMSYLSNGKQSPSSVNATDTTLNTLTGIVSNITSRLDKMEQNQNQVGQQTENVYRPRRQPKPSSAIICWRCGYTGHRWRHCYAKRGVDGKHLN